MILKDTKHKYLINMLVLTHGFQCHLKPTTGFKIVINVMLNKCERVVNATQLVAIVVHQLVSP